jgi:hypothetical protein
MITLTSGEGMNSVAKRGGKSYPGVARLNKRQFAAAATQLRWRSDPAGYIFDFSGSYSLPILASIGANLVAAGIIAVMAPPAGAARPLRSS